MKRIKLEKITYPRIQIITPARDKINDTKAKGNPIKKPKGLHSQNPSPIVFSQLDSVSLRFEWMNLKKKKKNINEGNWIFMYKRPDFDVGFKEKETNRDDNSDDFFLLALTINIFLKLIIYTFFTNFFLTGS